MYSLLSTFQNEDMKTEYIEILERLKNKQRKDHMKGSITGSVQANNRLMKELRDIYNSETFKKGKLMSKHVILLLLELSRICFSLQVFIP